MSYDNWKAREPEPWHDRDCDWQCDSCGLCRCEIVNGRCPCGHVTPEKSRAESMAKLQQQQRAKRGAA